MNSNGKAVVCALAAVLCAPSAVLAAAWTVPKNMRVVQKDCVASSSRQYTTIQPAIDNCAKMAGLSATKRCLVKVMHGTWDVTTPVVVKPYVDIEGSGDGTVIRSTLAVDVDINEGNVPSQATLITPPNTATRISNLRVENDAAAAPGVALLVRGATQVENVTAAATTGGVVEGFYNSAGIVVMGAAAQGVVLKNVTASAVSTGAYNRAWGVFVINGPSVSLAQSKATAAGPFQAIGVAVQALGTTPTTIEIRDCVVDASVSGVGYVAALEQWGDNGGVKVRGSKLLAHDSPSGECYGANGGLVEIMSSEVRKFGCLSGAAMTNMKIAASLIQGGIQQTPTVTNCWDENFAPIPNQ
jgi:hypothetical protein